MNTAGPTTTSLRVGLVLDRFDPRRGGVEQWTWQFAQFLTRSGHEVHVAARDFAPQVTAAGFVAHRLDAPRSRLALAQLAERTLRPLELDVVHDTGTGWFADVFQPHGGSRRASFERNLALLPAWQQTFKRAAARWLPRYREFDALAARQYAADGRIVLALSRMVAADLTNFDGVRAEQLRIVYNGVDCERFSPQHREHHRETVRRRLGVAPDETLLLIVAHNFWLKGVPTLLQAAGQLRSQGRGVRLIVAGGRPGSSWPTRAERAGAGAITTFVGPVDDPVPYYAAADIYVQPTFYDPCSLVVLEALAAGLPVVTSRFNGAGELITPGREGAVVTDPGDADELAAAIAPLCNPGVRMPCALAARSLARQHTLERNGREILAVYDEVRRQSMGRAA